MTKVFYLTSLGCENSSGVVPPHANAAVWLPLPEGLTWASARFGSLPGEQVICSLHRRLSNKRETNKHIFQKGKKA